MLPLLLLLAPPEVAPAPRPAGPDLAGFRTAKTALRADPKTFAPAAAPVRPGFAGIEVGDAGGKASVGAVSVDSPAAAAGLKAGDVVTAVGDTPIPSALALRDRLRQLVAGQATPFAVRRGDQALKLAVTPRPLSSPYTPTAAAGRAILGVTTEDVNGGLEVRGTTKDGPADKAGVKVGDRVLKLDAADVTVADGLAPLLAARRAGETVALLVRRGQDELTLRPTLVAEASRPTTGWDDRLPRAWGRPSFKLAVIGIDYPDVKHNPKVQGSDWEQSLFSVGKYTDKSATGFPVFGSMADYYREISYGQFRVDGKFVGWVEANKKRTEYSTGSGTSNREKTALLTEVLDKLTAKDADALKEYDGVFFLFAGGRVANVTRGSLYWPHRASVNHKGKRWPYFIVPEGGERMTDISVFCHEFGHMLGLPDLYARPELPGMEGVGVWCAMSQQNGNGRPQHFSAWCKEQLGWLKPVPVDPRVKQRIVLSPVEDDPGECVKVLLKPDGSEYLLLENRQQKGFDAKLPAAGLLIWRVLPGNANQKVFLEESHGVEDSTGPRSFLGAVPYPSPANASFTPYTTPSSRPQTGGGLDAWITDIRRLPDGRVSFAIGYEFQ